MDSIANGEICIKYKPRIYKTQKKIKYRDYNTISASGTPSIKEMSLDSYGKDYSYCDEFWVALVEKEGVNMVTIPHFPDIFSNEEMFFTDKKELADTFVSLTDFLTKGEYIGQLFKRTKQTTAGNRGYMDNFKEHNFLALYKYGDTLIGKITFNSFGEKDIYYGIMTGDYLEDGYYVFLGDYTDEYKDEVKLYREINQQLIKWNKSKSL